MTNEEYGRYVDALAPRSKTGKNLLNAFWVGGLICAIGQALLNGYQALGLDETTAGAAVSISLVLLSAILTGFAVYDDIAKFAGAARSCPSRASPTPSWPRPSSFRRRASYWERRRRCSPSPGLSSSMACRQA